MTVGADSNKWNRFQRNFNTVYCTKENARTLALMYAACRSKHNPAPVQAPLKGLSPMPHCRVMWNQITGLRPGSLCISMHLDLTAEAKEKIITMAHAYSCHMVNYRHPLVAVEERLAAVAEVAAVAASTVSVCSGHSGLLENSDGWELLDESSEEQ